MTADWATATTRLEALAYVLRFRTRWTAALSVAALLALSVLQRVDLALAAAHGPGSAAGGVGDLASPARLGSAERSVAVAQGWAAYQDELLPDMRSVPGLLTVYLAADMVLMTSLAALLLLWWARATRATPNKISATSRLSALPHAVRWVWIPAVLYLPADLVETVLATGQWRDLDLVGARVIAGASVVKWVALLLAAIPLVVFEWLQRDGRLRTVLGPLRGQFLVGGLLVAAFLALSGDLGLQIDDVLIRAVEGVGAALTATAAAVLCGTALYLGGLVRLRAYADAPDPKSIRVRTLAALIVVGALGLSLGIGVPLAVEAAEPWGGTWHLLAVIGGSVLVFALTSLPSTIHTVPDGPDSGPTRTDSSAQRVDDARKSLITFALPWLNILAALPFLVLALSVTRAATSQGASGRGDPGEGIPWTDWPIAVRMVLWVALLLILGWVLVTRLQRRASLTQAPHRCHGPITAVAVLVGSALMGTVGVQHAAVIGAPASVLLFITFLATFATGLVWLGDRIPARGSLAAIGLRRTPLIGLLLVLVVLASTVDRDGVYYDAVTAADQELDRPPAEPLVEPVDAFQVWATTHATKLHTPGSPRPTVSLVFVAAAGGGIKAAYWTAAGMSCALGDTCHGQDRTDQVFLASGVSGGSLGLAAVRANQEAETTEGAGRAAGQDEGQWYDRALDGDFVSASVTAFLFRDLPNAVFRLPFPEFNRASALQDAWERDLPALRNPFFRPPGTGPARWPYLALNGSSVEDGCRLSVSELRMAPKSGLYATPTLCAGEDASPMPGLGPRTYPVRDAAGYLCERVFGRVKASDRAPREAGNIRLSTAALLSARFPYVSPSGDLSRCGSVPDGTNRREDNPDQYLSTEHTYVVDGGLFDNSGATAVSQVWERISADVERWNSSTVEGRACVVPRLLVLDNHYDAAAAPSTAQRPAQVTAPPSAKDRVYDLRSTMPLARAEADIRAGAAEALAACGPGTPSAVGVEQSVALLRPVQRPGSKAPLGWTLSEWSREDMKRQLRSARNQCHVQTVRAWFGEGTARSDCEDADLSLSPSDVPL